MTSSELLLILAPHRGAANGISGKALTAKAGLPPEAERQVRKLISDLRFEGTAIVGTPETGYFLAESEDEIKQFTEFHFARARHSLGIISRVRGIALPALLGQLSLVEGKS
jgi:biotin operon repressor